MCGIREKCERRPIDPAPIIQLRVIAHDQPITTNTATTPSPHPAPISAQDLIHRGQTIETDWGTGWEDKWWYLSNPYYFLYAVLAEADSPRELHLLPDGKRGYATGSCVSGLHHLRDLDGFDQAFFVFPDLSVRVEGWFRLKLILYETVGEHVYFCSSVYTQPFCVYPPKRFPGMNESSALSRCFAQQGLKMRIRSSARGRMKRTSTDREMERYEDEDSKLVKASDRSLVTTVVSLNGDASRLSQEDAAQPNQVLYGTRWTDNAAEDQAKQVVPPPPVEPTLATVPNGLTTIPTGLPPYDLGVPHHHSNDLVSSDSAPLPRPPPPPPSSRYWVPSHPAEPDDNPLQHGPTGSTVWPAGAPSTPPGPGPI